MLSVIWLVCGVALIATGMPLVGCAAVAGAAVWQMIPGGEDDGE